MVFGVAVALIVARHRYPQPLVEPMPSATPPGMVWPYMPSVPNSAVPAGMAAPGVQTVGTRDDVTELDRLRDAGLLTDAEYRSVGMHLSGPPASEPGQPTNEVEGCGCVGGADHLDWSSTEQAALDDFIAAFGTHILAGDLYGLADDHESELVFDPPVLVRVIDTPRQDIVRWNDERHLDPWWDVRPVEPATWSRIGEYRRFKWFARSHTVAAIS